MEPNTSYWRWKQRVMEYARGIGASPASAIEAWDAAVPQVGCIVWDRVADVARVAISKSIDDAERAAEQEHQDRRDQVWALTHGWTVGKVVVYDQQGAQGWTWTSYDGKAFTDIGDWNELPTWPDEARKAVARQRRDSAA